jgi:cytochrome P450
MAESIEAARGTTQSSVLARLVNVPGAESQSDEEIRRNLSIICFGGISTVEALILNAMWALFEHPEVLRRVREDYALLPSVLEETMRWMSPVQSATRHVKEDMQWRGVTLRKNDVLNCMLGAANRDPHIFDDPDIFNIDRDNLRRHLGFAAGSHACLGFHLAKLEAGIAIEQLLRRLPSLTLDRDASAPPSGYEFRQSRRLIVNWHPT